jgi:hypothetical protein
MLNRDRLTKLTNSLESLTHRDRLLEVIKLGKQASNTPDVVNLIDDLQQGNQYHRLLALYSCYGSYNGARVLTAIQDNSRIIRRKAIKLITLVGSDEEVLEAMESLNLKQRRVLLLYLRQRKRLALIDCCLLRLIDRHERKIEQLLSYGTAELVNNYLTQIWERGGINEWLVLARLHPKIALDAWQTYAAQNVGQDWQFISYFNATLPRLAELEPDLTLALIQNLANHPSFNHLTWQALVIYRPLEAAQLVLTSPTRSRIDLNGVAHTLPPRQLMDLMDQQPQTVDNYYHWLPKLKPELRTAIYEHCHCGWRNQEGCLSPDLIKLFPQAIRVQAARSHLELPCLTTRPMQRIPYGAFLPWDETRAVIQPYLQNPNADLRILALQTIINATRYYRSRLPELLKLIGDRRHEQDPVRNAMLGGLASLPPSSWQQEHLADLDIILRDTLKAADLSQATASHGELIVFKLLPFHPEWSAMWLSKLAQARGEVSFYHLQNRLNDRQVQQLAPILLPVLKAWETREREWNIIQAASSLGIQIKVFDDLVKILERLLVSTRNTYYASLILSILGEHRRDRLESLIPQLLKKDQSWFTQSVVSNYLHRYRQDLLTPFLGQTAFKGKFSTGKTRFLLCFRDGYSRWTDKQQHIFAQSLANLTKDEQRDTPSIFQAVAELALLPAVEPTRLIELASLQNPQEAIRDRALEALSKLDSGGGVPVLLESLGDARARIAIYALRKSLMEMPVEQAVSILQSAAWKKITVGKEIVRLLGDLGSVTAYQELLVWHRRDLHRDLRIALLRSLWENLDKSDTWNILEQAAADPDEATATMVGRTPGDKLSTLEQSKLVSLLVTLLNRPEPTLRLAILRRCYQLPISDPEHILLAQLLKFLDSPYTDEVTAAANAVFATYRDAETIATTIKQIMPNRRSLELAIASLQNRLSADNLDFLPIVKAILAVLAIDPVTVSLQIPLAVSCLPGDELGAFFSLLNHQGVLHPDALAVAVNAVADGYYPPDLEQMSSLETALATSESENLRRIALAAFMAQTNAPWGWNQGKVERLNAYCQDSSLLVAAAAQFIFPPISY